MELLEGNGSAPFLKTGTRIRCVGDDSETVPVGLTGVVLEDSASPYVYMDAPVNHDDLGKHSHYTSLDSNRVAVLHQFEMEAANEIELSTAASRAAAAASRETKADVSDDVITITILLNKQSMRELLQAAL